MYNTLFLSIAIVFFILVVIAFFKDNSTTHKIRISSNNNLPNGYAKLLKFYGGDIHALLKPTTIKEKSNDNIMKDLFIRSGNPYNITLEEFFLLRVLLGMVGLAIGIVFFVLAIFSNNFLMSIIILFAFPIYAYNKPVYTIKKIAETKEKEIIKNLPELIDYLVIALSGGGYTLSNAFNVILPKMTPSPLKEEIRILVNDLNANKTLNQSLEELSYRLPIPSVRMFINSLINANNNSTSVADVLKNKSKEIRLDLEQIISKNIINADTKIAILLLLGMIVGMMIVVAAPFLNAILGSL